LTGAKGIDVSGRLAGWPGGPTTSEFAPGHGACQVVVAAGATGEIDGRFTAPRPAPDQDTIKQVKITCGKAEVVATYVAKPPTGRPK
jgi:hypothetical protein